LREEIEEECCVDKECLCVGRDEERLREEIEEERLHVGRDVLDTSRRVKSKFI